MSDDPEVDRAVHELIQQAADRFGWQLAEAAITADKVEAVPGTSPPLPGVRYCVCWEDESGPLETEVYRVVNEETGGATSWFEYPDPRLTSAQVRLLERFLEAREAATSPRHADC